VKQKKWSARLDAERLLDKVDLTKVDEIGFVDLTPGSGHGRGGFSDVGWIEVTESRSSAPPCRSE
jgi:hypothetical protein